MWEEPASLSQGSNPHHPTRVCAPRCAGNKADLESQRAVTAEEAAAYAAENGLFFLETSAKTAANVNELFTDIAQKLPKPDAAAARPPAGGVVLSDAARPPAQRSTCC